MFQTMLDGSTEHAISHHINTSTTGGYRDMTFLLDNNSQVVNQTFASSFVGFWKYRTAQDVVDSFNQHGKCFNYESKDRFGEELYYTKAPLNGTSIFDILDRMETTDIKYNERRKYEYILLLEKLFSVTSSDIRLNICIGHIILPICFT